MTSSQRTCVLMSASAMDRLDMAESVRSGTSFLQWTSCRSCCRNKFQIHSLSSSATKVPSHTEGQKGARNAHLEFLPDCSQLMHAVCWVAEELCALQANTLKRAPGPKAQFMKPVVGCSYTF